jgi:hypothetical protein
MRDNGYYALEGPAMDELLIGDIIAGMVGGGE